MLTLVKPPAAPKNREAMLVEQLQQNSQRGAAGVQAGYLMLTKFRQDVINSIEQLHLGLPNVKKADPKARLYC